MKYQRLLPLVLVSILWLLSQLFFARPAIFFVVLTLGWLLIILSARYLTRQQRNSNWVLMSLAPVLFWLTASLYVSVVSGFFLIQVIFLLEAWFIYSYFKNLYFHLAYAAPERLEKIDNLLLAGGFLGVFALGSFLYGLSAFINTPFIYLLLGAIPVLILFFGQFLPFQKSLTRGEIHLFFLLSLVLAELSGIFSLLPLNFNVLGLLLSLSYYILLLVARLFRRGELDRLHLKIPLLVSALIVVLLLLTSRWL